MKKFKPSFLTLSLMAAGLSIYAAPTLAQEDNTGSQASEEDVEVIQVKGFRSSLIKSLNTKRFADTVVDAISADDIGGLPDVSIADALSRIPGVTSIRVDGQSSELNIRGLSGDYVMSTLNGREMVSSAGGRSVQFDQFPSELIKQAQIYKSQKASLIEGGVAGTVELQTVNALDLDKEYAFRFSGQINNNSEASDNPDASSIGKRFTISYQHKLLDDTLGLALGYARLDQPTVSSRFISYSGSPTNTSAYEGLPDNLIVSPGFEINQRGGDDVRDSFVASVNWTPTDNLRVVWDGFYTEFDSVKFDRGILVGESGSGTINRLGVDGQGLPFPLALTNPLIAQVGDGNPVLVGGTFTRDPNGTSDGPPSLNGFANCNCLAPQIQNDNSSTFSKTLATGLKIEWDINDNWSSSIDFSHSSAEENSLDEVLRLVMFQDSSVDRPVVQDEITLNYQLNGLSVPTVQFSNLDFTNLNQLMAASYERYPRIEDNEANAVRVDFEYQVDSNDFVSSVEFGARWSKREYELARGVFRIGSRNGLTETNTRSGQYIEYGIDENGNVVEIGAVAPFRLTDDMVSTVNFGGELAGFQSFAVVDDLSGLVDAWVDQDISAVPRWGFPNGVDENGRTIYRDATPWSVTNGSQVEEEVTAAYLQANLNMEISEVPITGNVGMRIVDTQQQSLGLVQVGEGLGDVVEDGLGNKRDDYARRLETESYQHYLPSVNLNFAITDSDQLRFAYAKVLSRADLGLMSNGGSYSINTDTTREDGAQSVTGNFVDLNANGNFALRPFEAEQIDLSYERYFSETDGAFVFALWNKQINNFTTSLTSEFFDFEGAGIAVPVFRDGDTGEVLETINGNYTREVNVDDAGYLRGIEIAYTQTFTFLPDMWKGLGVNLNFSYTESEITLESALPNAAPEDRTPLPGLSARVWTGTVYYDYDEKFSARVSARYRSPYLSEQIAIGQSEQAFFEEETVISAQMSYNVNESLQIFASVDNLTDEPNISFFGDRAQTGTLQYFGRTAYLGFNYNL